MSLPKEIVISCLQEQYKANGVAPRSKGFKVTFKEYDLSERKIIRLFGGWNKALEEAGIPITKAKSRTEPETHFTEKACSGEFCNGKIIPVARFIWREKYQMYSCTCRLCEHNKGQVVDVGICKQCKKEHDCSYGSGIFCSSQCSQGYSSMFSTTDAARQKKLLTRVSQRVIEPKRGLIIREGEIVRKEQLCSLCKSPFTPATARQYLCSEECRKEKQAIGGRLSALTQQERSKNEIYFAELCEEFFGPEDVLTNDPMFDGWDADVIIPSIGYAILWNGIWHYEQITSRQSLPQTQARDRIKLEKIQEYDYTPYIIKDMGKYNPKLVEEAFSEFIFGELCKHH